jgi:hypothetical protein
MLAVWIYQRETVQSFLRERERERERESQASYVEIAKDHSKNESFIPMF